MPDALEKRLPGALEIARLPAGEERVERDDDRPVAGRLGPVQEAGGEVAVGGPVELKPLRPVPRGRDLLHGRGGHRAHGHRQPDRRGRPGRRLLAVVVHDRLNPDGGQADGRGAFGAEHRRRQVARRDVAQHPRHDPPAAKGRLVGADGVRGSGPARDVVPALGIGDALRLRRQLGPGQRLTRALPGQPAEEDLPLVGGERRPVCGWHGQASWSSRLSTLPVWLRGSSSRNTTSRGLL